MKIMKLVIMLFILISFGVDSLYAQTGGQAMSLQFTSLEGKKVDVKDLRGRVVLIDCWATWCAPCLKEMPHIKEVHNKYKEKGFEVIGVSMDEKSAEERVRGIVTKKNVTWPQRFEGKGFKDDTMTSLYNIQALPATFLLDKDGKIVDRDARGERLESLIIKYLSEE